MKFELEPYNRGVSDEVMLEDLRKVASKLAKESVTQKEYDKNGGRFAAATIKKRIGWCKAHELAGLKKNRNYKITREECIAGIKQIAEKLKKTAITKKEYFANVEFSERIIYRLFDSWKVFVESAGLHVTPGYHEPATEDQLFENIERIWELLGRQPKTSDFSESFSRFSARTYAKRFGSLRKALEAFVASVAIEGAAQAENSRKQISEILPQQSTLKVHKTSRTVSWRMRFLVMRRDDFKCCIDGKSPATHPGTVLVVDHITPWDVGGETVMENLQTLCEPCNGGKSNLPMKES